jgi:hypothetical protein
MHICSVVFGRDMRLFDTEPVSVMSGVCFVPEQMRANMQNDRPGSSRLVIHVTIKVQRSLYPLASRIASYG